jgi:hypothetical protein
MDVSELTVDEYLALSPGAIRDLRAAISSNVEDLFKTGTNELSEWVCARSCGRARSWRRKALFFDLVQIVLPAGNQRFRVATGIVHGFSGRRRVAEALLLEFWLQPEGTG